MNYYIPYDNLVEYNYIITTGNKIYNTVNMVLFKTKDNAKNLLHPHPKYETGLRRAK